MASPQKKNGYVGIANELWDEIIRRDFTKRQKDILQFVLRLSYGCGQKAAIIPRQQDFTLCGLGGKGHVGAELKRLEALNVLFRNRKKNEYALNKNYDTWNVQPVRGWDDERFKELVHLNIGEAKKRNSEVTKTGTESYQNGNFDSEEKLPKRELVITMKVTKTGTFSKKKLLKRELPVTKTGTSTAFKRSDTKGYERSKKGLKKKVIKKDLKDIVVFDVIAYLNAKTNKRFSPKTDSVKKWINGRISEGKTLEDFKHVIDVKTAEWLANPRMNKYLRPSTLFTPTNFENYLNESLALVVQGESKAQTANDRMYERNKREAEKIMEAIERERVGNPATLLENQQSF